MITQDELKRLISYDPITGIFTRSFANGIASIAGCPNKDGYLCISIKSRDYYAHRLAWLYVHGFLPPHRIDHKDRNRANNRIDNLRLADGAINAHNTGKKRGVFKRGSKYEAGAMVRGVRHFLGAFETEKEASSAYMAFIDEQWKTVLSRPSVIAVCEGGL